LDYAVGILLGLGLAASCGFRVFVPLLISNVASLTGYINFGTGYEWMGTWPAFIIFVTATVIEISAYYVPWLDNAGRSCCPDFGNYRDPASFIYQQYDP
jgi:hypothetical protein